jgi:di/tricarboxylate transporter
MEPLTRFLFEVLGLSVAEIVVMIFLGICGQVETEMLLKTIGGGVIVLIACLITLAINLQVLKTKNRIADEEDRQAAE